ncbi:MAG: hypothetical protein A2Y14_01910 [Verrucomicrobia bacterium GWF2_51_19]|nr:MAG: hypothetical protein A2Y14_01910 [Verrucomicrobia bacterium GWF2_51_19]HCJ11856.1 chemotaxis protein CheX [Opitutae bacterium]
MDIEIAGISEKIIQDMIVESVEKVFKTMLSLDISFTGSASYSSDPSKPAPVCPISRDKNIVAGSVGFIGTINGVMYIYLEEALAIKLTGSFLGMTETEVTSNGHETVNDALGELTNMTVGTFKNQLCDMGYNCRLTIPSILRGNHFAVETTVSSSIVRTSYRFQTGGVPYVVDLLMKKN